LETRKKNALSELKKKTSQIKNSYHNCDEIHKIKENISKIIINKITNSFAPKEYPNKRLSIDSKTEDNYVKNKKSFVSNEESYNEEDEMIDEVKENDIILNRNLKRSYTINSTFKKPSTTNRISKGYIGDLNFNQNIQENN